MANELTQIEAEIKRQLAMQQEQAASLAGDRNFISFKNGNMKINGQAIPNNSADVRVLAVIAARAWYDGPFDPDSPQVPACYSLGGTGVPHPQSHDPQSDICKTCKWNQWGSATPRPGAKSSRGKACREFARVVVTPAQLNLETAPLYMANVPVTSMKNADMFTSRCNQAGKLYGEFLTQLQVVEDNKTFFKVLFNIKEHIVETDLGVLLKRQQEATELAMEPYPDFDE